MLRLPFALSSPSIHYTAMSLEDRLAKTAISVLREQLRPDRRVTIQPRAFVPPLLPPPPIEIPSEGDWPDSFRKSIDAALDKAWSPATIKTYRSAVNVFLKFCHAHRIPAAQTFPASDYLLCAFLASVQPSLSKNTIKNYLSGLRAWHVRNGFTFARSDRLNLLAKASRPLNSPTPPRPPVTLQMLTALARNLDLEHSFDCCVFACACTAFWGLARLGELIPAVYNFDRSQPPFPRVSAISKGRVGSLKLHLPWTKVKKWDGETIILPAQEEPVDPVAALNHHLSVNKLAPQALLFTYNDVHGSTLLLKKQFMSRCNAIWDAASPSSSAPTGHSFRIGGTSHLLLCGVHPDIIKQTGRWSSDSFLRYWRNLDTVIPNHTTKLNHRQHQLGEPRAALGCGLLPSGLASTAGASTSGARSKTTR